MTKYPCNVIGCCFHLFNTPNNQFYFNWLKVWNIISSCWGYNEFLVSFDVFKHLYGTLNCFHDSLRNQNKTPAKISWLKDILPLTHFVNRRKKMLRRKRCSGRLECLFEFVWQFQNQSRHQNCIDQSSLPFDDFYFCEPIAACQGIYP